MVYLNTYYTGKKNKWLILSFLIRILQSKKYDHCAFSLSNDKKNLIYESQVWKTHKRDANDFFSENKVIHEFKTPISEEEEMNIRQAIQDNEGIVYGVIQIIGLAFILTLFRITGLVIRNPYRDKNKTQVCSEYVGKILILLGATLPDKLDLDSLNVSHCLEMNKNIDRSIRMK